MLIKADIYRQMADHAAGSLTAEVRDWCRFLIMAGRFYKYGFMDQVMIYTQRPDATACAEFDLWSVRMDRRIKPRSKGIALLYRTSGGRIAIRYVFDVSDTERCRESSRDPKPWTYRPEYEHAVMSHLEKSLGMSGARDLPGQLTALAIQSATERWNDFKYEIIIETAPAAADPAPAQPMEDTAAPGEGKPAAAPVSQPGPPAGIKTPEPEAPIEPEPEESGQLSILSTKPAATPGHPSEPAAGNFKIADDNPGAGGPKARYAANTAAIRLLKRIEAENRRATPDEQEILSRYAGWGGVPDTFEPDKPEWADEYAELKSLLAEEEYASARASVLNSHYKPPAVIRAIWEAIGGMGFNSGNILEPSMGIGHFFGCLPESMEKSRLYGVELDGISGRIAKQLYPKAHITVAGFETTDRRDFYDLAVGNVPFGQYQVNDPAYNNTKL